MLSAQASRAATTSRRLLPLHAHTGIVRIPTKSLLPIAAAEVDVALLLVVDVLLSLSSGRSSSSRQ